MNETKKRKVGRMWQAHDNSLQVIVDGIVDVVVGSDRTAIFVTWKMLFSVSNFSPHIQNVPGRTRQFVCKSAWLSAYFFWRNCLSSRKIHCKSLRAGLQANRCSCTLWNVAFHIKKSLRKSFPSVKSTVRAKRISQHHISPAIGINWMAQFPIPRSENFQSSFNVYLYNIDFQIETFWFLLCSKFEVESWLLLGTLNKLFNNLLLNNLATQKATMNSNTMYLSCYYYTNKFVSFISEWMHDEPDWWLIQFYIICAAIKKCENWFFVLWHNGRKSGIGKGTTRKHRRVNINELRYHVITSDYHIIQPIHGESFLLLSRLMDVKWCNENELKSFARRVWEWCLFYVLSSVWVELKRVKCENGNEREKRG